MLTLIAMSGQALAHGTWYTIPAFRFTAATAAEVESRIYAGLPPIVQGNVLEFVAEMTNIGGENGGNAYITFYVPPGFQVMDLYKVAPGTEGPAIPVRDARPTIPSNDGLPRGWGALGAQNFFTGVNGWSRALAPGECASEDPLNPFTLENCMAGMAFLSGDTGVFYSTDPRTAFYSGDGTNVAKETNGYGIKPSSAAPWGAISRVTPAKVHNEWDATQSMGFGTAPGQEITGQFNMFGYKQKAVTPSGRGPAPFRAGSPVAGPHAGSPFDRSGQVGPWQRVNYPGSCIATDPAIANGYGQAPAVDPGRVVGDDPLLPYIARVVCSDASSGYSSFPLPLSTNNVRIAVGGVNSGETLAIRVNLKWISGNKPEAFNMAASGGDAAFLDSNKDNMWRYWVGAPSNLPVAGEAYNKLILKKEIVSVNGEPYVPGTEVDAESTVRYRIMYANAGAQIQTNVQLSDVFPIQKGSTSNFVVIQGPNIVPDPNPNTGNAGSTTYNFPVIAELAPLEVGIVEFDMTLRPGTSGTGATTNTARILSDQLPLLTSSVSFNVTAPSGILDIAKSVEMYQPSVNGEAYIPGKDVVYTITVSNNHNKEIDTNTIVITDTMPPELQFYRGAFAANGQPVEFIQGVPTSNLTCCTNAQLSVSTDGVNFVPIAVQDSYLDITHLRVMPSGKMARGGSATVADPLFSLRFRARIK